MALRQIDGKGSERQTLMCRRRVIYYESRDLRQHRWFTYLRIVDYVIARARDLLFIPLKYLKTFN